jgi:hypothetical protein
LVAAIPDLSDCPTAAIAAETVTEAYRSFSDGAEIGPGR